MTFLGISFLWDEVTWSSIPWPALQFPDTDWDHVGGCESYSAPTFLSSEGAQAKLSKSQTPGKCLLDDAFKENKYQYHNCLHACFFPLWLTFTWDWWRCSHFICSWNVPSLTSQSILTRRSWDAGCRQPLRQETFWELAASFAVVLPSPWAQLWHGGQPLLRAALHQLTTSELHVVSWAGLVKTLPVVVICLIIHNLCFLIYLFILCGFIF